MSFFSYHNEPSIKITELFDIRPSTHEDPLAFINIPKPRKRQCRTARRRSHYHQRRTCCHQGSHKRSSSRTTRTSDGHPCPGCHSRWLRGMCMSCRLTTERCVTILNIYHTRRDTFLVFLRQSIN